MLARGFQLQPCKPERTRRPSEKGRRRRRSPGGEAELGRGHRRRGVQPPCVVGGLLAVSLFLNCSLVDLHCGLSFRCAAKWFSKTHTLMLSESLFDYKLLKISNNFNTQLYSRSLVVICCTYSGVYLLVPNSWFIPHLLPSPLVTIPFLCLWVYFGFIIKFISVIFCKIPHVSDITWYLSLSDLLHLVWSFVGPSM